MSTCAICVEDTESPVCCVPCGHVYCHECIDNWQKSQKSVSKCPECRKRIQDVMAIYIKRDDSKDEVKSLVKRIDDLQSQLGIDMKDHKESILNHKEEKERITRQLDHQRTQTNLYKEKLDTHLKEKKNLQRKIQTLTKREEKIRNESEISLIIERENTKRIERKKDQLQETVANYQAQIKNLKDIVNEQKDEMHKLEDRWLMRFIKSTDKFKMVMICVSTFLTDVTNKSIDKAKKPFQICVDKMKKLGKLCFKAGVFLTETITITLLLKAIYDYYQKINDYQYIQVVLAYLFMALTVLSVSLWISEPSLSRHINNKFWTRQHFLRIRR